MSTASLTQRPSKLMKPLIHHHLHKSVKICRAHAGLAASPPNSTSIVVVGGGIGGLSAAGRLSRAGLPVTVFEQNTTIGGRAQSENYGWRFDTGPSLLLMPSVYRETFKAIGCHMDDHVTLKRVDPAYRVFFQDNGFIDITYDVQSMVQQLQAMEPGAGGAYIDLLAAAQGALDLGFDAFVARDIEGLADLARLPALLPQLSRTSLLDLLAPHASRVAARFRDPRLRALFTFQDLYVGLTPYTAPAVFSLLLATEVAQGVWYPIGGFGKVRDSLAEAVSSSGAHIRCGAEVQEINCSLGRVTGVTLTSGEHVPADIVLANRDLPAAYELVRGPYAEQQRDKLAKKRYSAGVISFYWSLDRTFPHLQHHNIFLSGDYEKSWQRAISGSSLPERPNFYVHCPARTDPSVCPADCDSVMILLPVANLQETAASEYEALVQLGRERIVKAFREAGVGDVLPHIVEETVRTPGDWQDLYSLQYGAAFGLDHGLDQLSIFRPSNKDNKVKGLYFVGASTRPGNGVPLVMLGAAQVADRILRDLRL
eukprot:jgi/Botrbrau1/16354/Bobra.178_1s0007.1